MNLTSPRVVSELMTKYGLKFDHSLGQNFLIDNNILNKILETVPNNSIAIEIGPGLGTVTQKLVEKCEKVIAIEISSRLCEILRDNLGKDNNLEIINENVLKLNTYQLFKSLKARYPEKKIEIIGNLPYYITTPIIFQFLESDFLPDLMTFVIQKEVAERIISKPNSKNYGSLSVNVQYYGNAKIIHKIPASCFFPAPKIDSSIIVIEINDKNRKLVSNEKLFLQLVKSSFGYRRKRIVGAIENAQKEKQFEFEISKSQLENILIQCNLPCNVRGEELELNQFIMVANSIDCNLNS